MYAFNADSVHNFCQSQRVLAHERLECVHPYYLHGPWEVGLSPPCMDEKAEARLCQDDPGILKGGEGM